MPARAAAPLDLAQVEMVLQPFERALTLPGAAYASEDVFAWEQEHFVEGSWMCVGREGDLDLERPGDQTAIQVGSQSFLLVRADDGALRAFHNICRHRGHELLSVGEHRNQRGVRCPYHAWVYGLTGDCRAAPRFDMDGFDKGAFPLVEARLASWQGWLFLNASGDAPPIEEHLGNLGLVVDGYAPASLRLGARHEYELRANWKIVIENYLECYHCSEIHPALCKVTPPDSDITYGERSQGMWIGGPMELRDHASTMSLTGESLGVTIPGLPEDRQRVVGYAAAFPNLLISPHPDYVMTHRLVPRAADRTWVECAWYFPEEAFSLPGFSPGYASEFWDVTNAEDWLACGSVQRNVGSRGYRSGPFSYWEVDVFRAQAMVARGYLEGRLAPPAHDLVSGPGRLGI
ncbi:MAG TPA: aromatic ring-hydroxylating dioxygenase subunit alpha [Actinomycetota bacterium]